MITCRVTAQPQAFTQAVCEGMARACKRPLIFALSNPTSKSECTAEQAYKWTNGTCVFARSATATVALILMCCVVLSMCSGSPFPPVTLNGKTFVPGQGNNCYHFPGLSHGIICAGVRRVSDQMFYIAAKTLAANVSEKDLANGTVYPPVSGPLVAVHIRSLLLLAADVRRVSAMIAAAVGEEAYQVFNLNFKFLFCVFAREVLCFVSAKSRHAHAQTGEHAGVHAELPVRRHCKPLLLCLCSTVSDVIFVCSTTRSPRDHEQPSARNANPTTTFEASIHPSPFLASLIMKCVKRLFFA